MKREEIQREFAREAHEKAWELLETEGRTADQDGAMIEAAHVSAYHWTAVGSGLNHQRAQWLLSRVYSVLGMGERALYHARRCQALTDQHQDLMLDFDRAFALEGLARAHAVAGDLEQAAAYMRQAEAAGGKISDADDRNYFLLDLKSGQWHGLLVE